MIRVKKIWDLECTGIMYMFQFVHLREGKDNIKRFLKKIYSNQLFTLLLHRFAASFKLSICLTL